MNTHKTKIALFAGIGLLGLGATSAYSQSCNSGYSGSDYLYQSCPPSYSYSSDCETYGNSYDACPTDSYRTYQPQQTYQRQGRYNQNYARRGQQQQQYHQTQRVRPQSRQQYPMTQNYPVAQHQAPQRALVEKVSYLEAILNFLLTKLGLQDEFEASQSTGPVAPAYPQASRASGGDCAGGS